MEITCRMVLFCDALPVRRTPCRKVLFCESEPVMKTVAGRYSYVIGILLVELLQEGIVS